jgi:hypothetical protein
VSSSCSPRERREDAFGDAGRVAAFEAGVVVDADPGEERDLLPAKTGHAPVASVGAQTRLLRRDLRAPRDQELADFFPRIHNARVALLR